MHNESRPEAPLRVLVVGAGFAGLGLAIRLRQAGIDDYLVLEKAADVGGCWRENRYPGAACDVPSHLYSFSFEPKADWSRKFAPQVQRLSLFQRSAPYVIAKPDRAYADWERRLKARWPWLQRLDRGLKYLHHESRMLAFATFPALMKVMRLSFHRHLHRQIADPQLRARLVPDYPLGCKRILISNDYYPALARSNVELVDTGIREVTEDAVVGRDGRRHEVDAIIFGTGFAATEFLAPMRILGLDGRDLRQAWADGAEAYKGISVSGFPNLFILYGPNTNLGHNSIVYMLESQFPYVLGCLRQLQAQGLRYLDVKPEVQRRFNLEVQQGLRHTVWERGCDSWYKTAAGKNTNNWPGYTFVYRWRTRRPELADYDLAR